MMDATPLCPSPRELRLDRVSFHDGELIVHAIAARRVVACPKCGQASRRVHSRYRRRITDLPWHGLRVRFDLSVRRFFCDHADCPRKVFTERLPATTAAYARRTNRAAAALNAIGFAVGGRPGARLAELLGLRVSAAVVVAALRAAPEESHETPRVLGIDDWAVRRNVSYGTIVVDLERHRVVDVLPDRDTETAAAWLRTHPGVEIISRDRGGAYADAVRATMPDAIQVADRFHLLLNMTEALSQSCARHDSALRKVKEELTGPPCPREAWRLRRYSGLPTNRAGPTAKEQRVTANRARRLARYEEVVTLHNGGASDVAIAKALHLNRRTVARWLAVGHFPERQARARQRRGTRLDAFMDYVEQRHREGIRNASALYRELQPRGYQGSAMTVRRTLAALRQRDAQRGGQEMAAAGPTAVDPTPAPPPPIVWPADAEVPTVRQTVWLLRTPPTALRPHEQDYVELVCERIPPLAVARRLALEFIQLLQTRDGNALRPWIIAAEKSELAAFARGLDRDYDAVLAGVLFRWSNGQVEGQVHRLKAIKRAMFGRANFDLLRKRVLHHGT